MSFSHMVILGVIALIVIPPDKLPEVARQLARFFNDLKRSTSGIWDDLKQEAMLTPEDLMRKKNGKPVVAEPVIAPVTTTPEEKKPNE